MRRGAPLLRRRLLLKFLYLIKLLKLKKLKGTSQKEPKELKVLGGIKGSFFSRGFLICLCSGKYLVWLHSIVMTMMPPALHKFSVKARHFFVFFPTLDQSILTGWFPVASFRQRDEKKNIQSASVLQV